jgi:transcriptional regulator with XRE-family HTH domain
MSTHELGKRLLAWRGHRGLTQSDIGLAAGVTKSAVSSWERGETSPSQHHLALVVDLLGVSMQDFYGLLPVKKAVA